jgi:signal peptidase I
MNTPTNTNTKRHPWLAVFLSLLMPGLGQLYCGATIKCFWIAGAMSVIGMFSLVPLALMPLIQGFQVDRKLVIFFEVLALLLYGINILDALITARRTREDYKLKDYNRWYAYLLFWLAVSGGYVFSGLYVRDNLLQAFRVPAASMYPAVWPGDQVLVAKNTYLDEDPKVGDIVVFHNPEDRRQFFIKRVVALGGDSVEIRDGEVYINDIQLKREEVPSPKVIPRQLTSEGTYFYEWNGDVKYRIFTAVNAAPEMRNFPKTVIPKYHCFVLGDNRDNSLDSRQFGPVPIVGILGEASFIYLSAQDWSRFGSIR